ncbi:MAG: type II secretion system protein [Armatimonadota bacterium]|jgi:type II secretory pathway pseudopilin PulG
MSSIARRSGVTVLELVVVMAVIIVLAAIAIPVAMSAQREANEAKLLAELRQIRQAINRFVADCGGYPDRLEDLVTSQPPRRCRSVESGRRMPIDPVDFRGPYIWTPDEEFPRDPITRRRQWSYNRRSGEVSSRARGETLDGIRYRDL